MLHRRPRVLYGSELCPRISDCPWPTVPLFSFKVDSEPLFVSYRPPILRGGVVSSIDSHVGLQCVGYTSFPRRCSVRVKQRGANPLPAIFFFFYEVCFQPTVHLLLKLIYGHGADKL